MGKRRLPTGVLNPLTGSRAIQAAIYPRTSSRSCSRAVCMTTRGEWGLPHGDSRPRAVSGEAWVAVVPGGFAGHCGLLAPRWTPRVKQRPRGRLDLPRAFGSLRTAPLRDRIPGPIPPRRGSRRPAEAPDARRWRAIPAQSEANTTTMKGPRLGEDRRRGPGRAVEAGTAGQGPAWTSPLRLRIVQGLCAEAGMVGCKGSGATRPSPARRNHDRGEICSSQLGRISQESRWLRKRDVARKPRR